MTSAFLKRFENVMILMTCCPEFDSFLRDLAIFPTKSNKQHSSIPKSQKNLLATFSLRNKT